MTSSSSGSPAPALKCGKPAVGHFTWGNDNREGDLCADHLAKLQQDPNVHECINHTPLPPDHGRRCPGLE